RVDPHTSARPPGVARYLALHEARRRDTLRAGPTEGPTVRVKGSARSVVSGRHSLTSLPAFRGHRAQLAGLCPETGKEGASCTHRGSSPPVPISSISGTKPSRAS